MATGQVAGRAPSVVAAVVRDGRPVWQGGWGTVDGQVPDGDIQYRIGSITKTFLAVLVLRLRDEGRLALTDPLGEHLPGTVAGEATIGALLAHTAGLIAEAPGPWWERTPGTLRPDLADVLGNDPQLHPAGHRHHYSNPGYAPHATGWAVHPWADVLLAEPAVDTGLMAPAGQLWSTTTDLARFAAFLIDGDDRVLHPDTVAQIWPGTPARCRASSRPCGSVPMTPWARS
ncbi:hypothetical protein Vgi01_40010 [Micromonospora gifhornensis]|uniref:Beta-lactamase-related domain-containing protein n=1 Tax=Micromonospora gifhornensis TaxID=84594 RepID=A0ABQ4IHF8_9ACTN|nr:hypothetical protein Vgi01_40010 [Micromonospora gifhornensis]